MINTPKGKQNTPVAANPYRDRFNKKRSGSAGAPGNSSAVNTHNHLRNTSPGSTARKAKKGFRPG